MRDNRKCCSQKRCGKKWRGRKRLWHSMHEICFLDQTPPLWPWPNDIFDQVIFCLRRFCHNILDENPEYVPSIYRTPTKRKEKKKPYAVCTLHITRNFRHRLLVCHFFSVLKQFRYDQMREKRNKTKRNKHKNYKMEHIHFRRVLFVHLYCMMLSYIFMCEK